jgi:predicted DNA-binding antitoxin AbrB/MazE fold protein
MLDENGFEGWEWCVYMERTLEVIYENGVLTPLEPLDLPERQRIKITIAAVISEDPGGALAAWQDVYAGLSEDEIAAIESVALNRKNFMRSA